MAKQNALLNHTRTALVDGADHLGTFPTRLAEEGVQIAHWRGRNMLSKLTITISIKTCLFKEWIRFYLCPPTRSFHY